MPRDLFDTVTHPPTHVRSGSGLTLSIVTHAVGLAALVAVPLLATDVLPVPPFPFDTVILADFPPDLPVPAVSRPGSASASTASVVPRDAPSAIVPEPASAPPSDLGDIVPGAIFPGGTGGTGDDGRLTGLTPPPPVPPAPVAVREPVRVGGLVTAPTKVYDVAPVYPVIARSAGLQGTVILQATIGLDGGVEDVQVLRSIPLLDEAAVTAVRQWRYTPTRLNGQPVAVIMTVTVSFRLR